MVDAEPADSSRETADRLLHSTEWEAPGKRCATGGLHARSGLDHDDDGALDEDEVDEATLTCNDPQTTDGPCVSDRTGSAPALVVCTTGEFAGHCKASGLRIDHGRDPTRNGVLDDGEVEKTEYACVPDTECDASSWESLVPSLICCDMAGVDMGGGDWNGVNLTDANLEDASLLGADLSRTCADCPAASFTCANLSRAILTDANVSDASFGGANLSEAKLDSTVAEGAQFEAADLTGAALDDARLRGAKLSYADLIGATLRRADLRDADLNYANLRGADLTSARLAGAATGFLQACPASVPDRAWACVSGARPVCGQELQAPMFALIGPEADLAGANLTGRALVGMDLSGADLTGAQLGGSSLRGTMLRGASLAAADLGGADLRGAQLESVDITGAITAGAATDSTTICPGGEPGPCW